MQSATERKYNIDPQELYRTAAAAKLVKESIPTLQRRRCRGEGAQYIKNGKTILYPGYSLISYLDSCLVEPTATNAGA